MEVERPISSSAHRGIVMSGARALQGVTARSVQPRVLACALSRHQRAYLTDGLRRRATLDYAERFSDVEALLPSSQPFDVVVLAPVDSAGRDAVSTIERLATSWPGTAIVVFCPSARVSAPPLRALVLAGAHQMVFEGVHDTAAAVGGAVDMARRESAAEQVMARLEPLVPARLHSLVQVVLTNPAIASVSAAADALGVHRKTLVNRCSDAGIVAPGELIAWVRLAMVGHQLECTGLTVEAIAHNLEFPSHTSLRNLVKRYTRQTATEIREGDGLGAVIAAFMRRLVGELPVR
jgi:AraC-like DNA-binding protein